MATKEQRQNKQMVERLLLIEGIEYDKWVDEFHTSYIQSNQKLIFEALDSKINKGKEKKENVMVTDKNVPSSTNF